MSLMAGPAIDVLRGEVGPRAGAAHLAGTDGVAAATVQALGRSERQMADRGCLRPTVAA